MLQQTKAKGRDPRRQEQQIEALRGANLEVLGYQLSDNFERFYETHKDLLGLEDIVFVPMSEHPQQAQHGSAYGTTSLSEDGRTLQVFLNPERFNLHPPKERDYVAEVIAVHEILHPWTRWKGFPEVCGAEVYPAFAERFTNLFHHRVINKEMDRLGYDYSIPDRLVAQQFVEYLERETAAGPLPTYDTSDTQFCPLIMILATARDQFTNEEFDRVVPFFAYSNPEIATRSEACFRLIEDSRCWDSPVVMFEVMMQVREILELTPNILDFKNPETGEWTDPDAV
jgi:hypothetical protein